MTKPKYSKITEFLSNTMKRIPVQGTYRNSFLLLCLFVLLFPLGAQTDPGGNLEYHQGSDGKIYFYAQYDGIIPSYLWVEFPQLQNLIPSTPFPRGFVLPPTVELQRELPIHRSLTIPEDLDLPEDGVILFYLEPRPNTSTRFQIQYRFTWGKPVQQDDLNHIYLFPYPHGTKYRITQGYNGAFTHFSENRYALDFNLDTGDAIHAAREGIVVAVKQDSNRGGLAGTYARDGNYILIYHEDGTFGNYVHLKLNGALVRVGERITSGQLIGYAGATGQASGPHLHFDVRITTESGRFQSIPIRFLGLDDDIIDPESGKSYYAVHPGGPDFTPVFGDDLRDGDFARYSEQIPHTGTIEIRTELIDSTTLVFLRNGHNESYWVETSFNLTNLNSTQGTRIVREVPPNTEVYLTILRPRNPEGGWSHRIQYRFRPL